MIILQAGEQGRLAPLFKGAQATPVWSCLQGYMGEAAADDAVSPRCARILLGDFCYPAGDSGTAEAAELIGSLPPRPLLAIPPDGEWARLIERVWTGRCRRIERYAIKKEPDVFRHSRLEPSILSYCRRDGAAISAPISTPVRISAAAAWVLPPFAAPSWWEALHPTAYTAADWRSRLTQRRPTAAGESPPPAPQSSFWNAGNADGMPVGTPPTGPPSGLRRSWGIISTHPTRHTKSTTCHKLQERPTARPESKSFPAGPPVFRTQRACSGRVIVRFFPAVPWRPPAPQGSAPRR